MIDCDHSYHQIKKIIVPTAAIGEKLQVILTYTLIYLSNLIIVSENSFGIHFANFTLMMMSTSDRQKKLHVSRSLSSVRIVEHYMKLSDPWTICFRSDLPALPVTHRFIRKRSSDQSVTKSIQFNLRMIQTLVAEHRFVFIKYIGHQIAAVVQQIQSKQFHHSISIEQFHSRMLGV